MKPTGRFLQAILLCAAAAHSQVTLASDFTLATDLRDTLVYHWNIFNRISPLSGIDVPATADAGICVVRPLGGKGSNGVKELDEDTYKWNGTRYYYDWAPLKRQIDNVLAKSRLFQLMIDNAPWAFQRGVDRMGFPEVDTYGNAWPPNDPKAWSDYIKAMLIELVKTYGRAEVAGWRFCIGREIGTGGHWRAGQAAFFEHYRITEKAIREVLPDSKVGAHFLWASAPNSYGPAFVQWCKANGARYDFVGVSYYPFYDQVNRVDMGKVYKNDFSPIKDHPDWIPTATLEIHEFALIKSMNQTGDGFVNAPAPYQETFTVMLARMMQENGMIRVFRWGSGDPDSPALQSMAELRGSRYNPNSVTGSPRFPGSMVNALFARDLPNKRYDAVAYNYSADPAANDVEAIDFRISLPALAGTAVKYRTGRYQKATRTLVWSAWLAGKTAPGSKENQSVFSLGATIESFSFVRLQVIPEKEVSTLRRRSLPPRFSEGRRFNTLGRSLFSREGRIQEGDNSLARPDQTLSSAPIFIVIPGDRGAVQDAYRGPQSLD